MLASRPLVARSGQPRALDAPAFPGQIHAKPVAGKHNSTSQTNIERSGFDNAVGLRRSRNRRLVAKPHGEAIHE